MDQFARFFIFCLTLLLINGCNIEKSEPEHIESAKDFLKKQEYQSAIISLKNALSLNSNNIDSRILLAQSYFETTNYAYAEKELTKSLQLAAPKDVVIPLLAKTYYQQGKYEHTLQLTSDGLSEASEGLLYATKALSAFSIGSHDLSETLIDRAISKNPYSNYILASKAKLLSIKNDSTNAIKTITKVLNNEPKNHYALSVLGDIQKQTNNFESADNAYTQAYSISPLSLNYLLSRTHIRILMRRWDLALEDANKLIKKNPHNPHFSYALGLIRFNLKEYEAAIEALNYAKKAQSRYPKLDFFLASSHFRLGNMLQAEHLAEKFISTDPNNIAGRQLLAIIALNKNDFIKAETIIRKASEGYDYVSLNILSEALLAQGKAKEANLIMEKITSSTPDTPNKLTKLAISHFQTRNEAEAIKALEHSLTLDTQFHQAYIILISYYLQQGNLKEATKVAITYQRNTPKSVSSHNLLGKVYLSSGREEEARLSFQKSQNLDATDTVSAGYLIDLALKNSDVKTARILCEKILASHPNHFDTMIRLSQVQFSEKGKEAMIKSLKQVMTAHPKEIRPRIGLARYYLETNNPEKVLDLLSEFTLKEQPNPVALELTAKAQFLRNDFLTARNILLELANLRPNSDSAYYHLSMTYYKLKDFDNMEKALDRTLSLKPGHFFANFDLGRLYLSRNEIDKASRTLELLKSINSEDINTQLLEASLLSKQGKHSQALSLYERIFEQKPSTQNVIALAKQHSIQGYEQEASIILETWMKEHDDDNNSRFVLAHVYNQMGQVNKANSHFMTIIEKDNNNAFAFNNLGWNLRTSDTKKALKYAEKAISLKPNSSNILDTLAIVQLHNNELTKARRNINRALEISPNNPDILYHSALISRATGDNKTARDLLNPLLEKNTNFRSRDEAVRLLEEIQ